MSDAKLITTIRKTFPDEWVTAQVTAVDEADVPVAGVVLSHSPDKQTVFQAVKSHRAAKKLDGIIGMNVLRQFRVTLESDTSTLVLRSVECPCNLWALTPRS